ARPRMMGWEAEVETRLPLKIRDLKMDAPRMPTSSPLQHLTFLPNGDVTANSVCCDDELDERESATPMHLHRIRRPIREISIAGGEDPDREGLKGPPQRVARMYAEVFQGLHQNPQVHLTKLFTQKYDEVALIRDSRFVSFCEHPLLPVIGKAHVAYIPNG